MSEVVWHEIQDEPKISWTCSFEGCVCNGYQDNYVCNDFSLTVSFERESFKTGLCNSGDNVMLKANHQGKELKVTEISIFGYLGNAFSYIDAKFI